MATNNQKLMTANEAYWTGQLLQAIRNLPRSLYIKMEEDIWEPGGEVLVFKRDKKEPWNRSRRVASVRKGSAFEHYRPEGA
jgi:hypothetical protein